ncbi:hypothetical protein GCM10008967_36870 [Bacillus carboniphilus]|uniref:Uncharacterized protein n=1 Tax=Bacillus carboniphilus TaxID=86663 RepID=A0ABN0WP00_9BACI
MEQGFPPNHPGDWARIEGERSILNPTQLTLLESWECSRDADQIMDTLKNMIPEFKGVHQTLAEIVEVDTQTEWVDTILSKVL